MRGRPSSKTATLSNNKVDVEDTQSHLSGAYIRSLVKQLTSSTTSIRTKEKMNQSKEHDHDSNQTVPPQPHRKQARRRLHTSRPYQERLLNMAEARREIVAALKFHRASMKQQEAEKQPVLQQLPTPPQSSFEQDEKFVKSRRNPRIYPSNTGAQSFQQDCLENISYPSLSLPPLPTHLSNSSPFSWNNSPDSLDFALPNQTLGLNLNFQDFSSLEGTPLYHNNNNNNNSISSYSSSSSSPPLSVATTEEAVVPSGEGTVLSPGVDGGCSHPVMNDEVMAEIRSIGEQHQIAWDDTMDLVTSAWWFKFLKTMEVDTQQVKLEENNNNNNNNDVYQYHPFDQVMEFPSWMNANEACFLQPLNGYCSEENYQDSPLPCMDIGEIEAMDEEWLS